MKVYHYHCNQVNGNNSLSLKHFLSMCFFHCFQWHLKYCVWETDKGIYPYNFYSILDGQILLFPIKIFLPLFLNRCDCLWGMRVMEFFISIWNIDQISIHPRLIVKGWICSVELNVLSGLFHLQWINHLQFGLSHASSDFVSIDKNIKLKKKNTCSVTCTCKHKTILMCHELAVVLLRISCYFIVRS